MKIDMGWGSLKANHLFSYELFVLNVFCQFNRLEFLIVLHSSRRDLIRDIMRKPGFGFLTKSDTSRAVQQQKMAVGFEFRK